MAILLRECGYATLKASYTHLLVKKLCSAAVPGAPNYSQSYLFTL
jgi:hypothetical protein